MNLSPHIFLTLKKYWKNIVFEIPCNDEKIEGKKLFLEGSRGVGQKKFRKKMFVFEVPWNGEKIELFFFLGGGSKKFWKKFCLWNPTEWREFFFSCIFHSSDSVSDPDSIPLSPSSDSDTSRRGISTTVSKNLTFLFFLISFFWKILISFLGG